MIGLFLVTSISSGVIVGDPAVNGGSAAGLINVLALPLHLRDLVFLGHIEPRLPPRRGRRRRAPRGRGVRRRCSSVSIGVLLRRYRWVER